MSRLILESLRISRRTVVLLQTLCVFVLVFVTVKAQFVIERSFRDIFRNLTACSDANPDFCYEMHAERSPSDNCVCRCKLLYPMFRNPDVYPSGGKYVSKKKAGCVWYANHRHECFHIRKRESDMGGDGALEFNFSKPGHVQVYSDHDIQSCSRLETAIKLPDDSDFKVVNGLLVAIRLKADLIRIQWNLEHKGYDGTLIKGVFRNCADTIKTADRCFVAKIAGVYNDNCTVRTVSGACCIFPFTYKGTVYNNCTTTVDNPEPWCATRLPFKPDESIWWEKCGSFSPTTSSIVNIITQTSSLAQTFSASILPSTAINKILPSKTHAKISTHGTPKDSAALLISSKQATSILSANIDTPIHTTAYLSNLRHTLSRKAISSVRTSDTQSTDSATDSSLSKATDRVNYTTPIPMNSSFPPSGKNRATSTLFSASLSNATWGLHAKSASDVKAQTETASLTGNFTASNTYDMTGSIAKPHPSRSEASSVGGTISVEPTKPDGNVAFQRADIGFVLLILAVVGGVTFLIILLVSCVVLCFWNKKKKNHNLPKRRYRSFEMMDPHFRRPDAQPSARHDQTAGTSQTSVLSSEAINTKAGDTNNEIEFTIPEQDFDSGEEGAKKNGEKNPSYITFKL